MYRIAQITDLHISDDLQPVQEVPVWENFMWALQEVASQKPDLVVLSGDLCYDMGNLMICEKIKEAMVSLGLHYHVIPGNHDDSGHISAVFGYSLENGYLQPYKVVLEHAILYFLDSGRYEIDLDDLEWVAQQINMYSDTQHLVFVHHPLATGAGKFMDTSHPLKNIQASEAWLQSLKHPIHCFHGHYHTEKTMRLGKANLYITPSTFYQIDSRSHDFKVASRNPAYRWIELGSNKMVTQIIWRD